MNLTKEHIYKEWIRHGSYRFFYSGCAVAIGLMALFLGLDIFTFEAADAQYFRNVRLIVIACLVGLCAFVSVIETSSRDNGLTLVQRLVMVPIMVMNTAFLIMLAYTLKHEPIQMKVLIGTVTVILMTYLFMGRFLNSLVAFFALSIVSIIAYNFFEPLAHFLDVLIKTHLTGFVCSYVFNRNVKQEHYDKFLTFSKFIPVRTAYELAVTNKRIEETSEAQLKKRFTAFLVCDWRSYQSLSAQLQSEHLSKLFKEVYSLAFSVLPDLSPDLTYYVSWTADEHRVTFYSLTDSEAEVKRMAVAYAKFLQQKLPGLIRAKLGIDLEYDIGICCGSAMTGLQGPHDSLQYTTLGEHPGIAKRFESEAASLRKTLKDNGHRLWIDPIIIMSNDFADAVGDDESHIVTTISKHKDTEGRSILIDYGATPPLRVVKSQGFGFKD